MPENMPLNMAELSGIELGRPSVDVQTFNSRDTCWGALPQHRRDGEKCNATEPDAGRWCHRRKSAPRSSSRA